MTLDQAMNALVISGRMCLCLPGYVQVSHGNQQSQLDLSANPCTSNTLALPLPRSKPTNFMHMCTHQQTTQQATNARL